LAALPALAAARPLQTGSEPLSEVVLELHEPGVAKALGHHRARLDLDTRASSQRLARIAAQQELVEQRIDAAVPAAKVSWRYRVVLKPLPAVAPQRSLH